MIAAELTTTGKPTAPGCACTALIVCRACIAAYYSRRGGQWTIGFEYTLSTLTPCEQERFFALVRSENEQAELAACPEFGAVCDARVQAAIDHQEQRYLAGLDAEMVEVAS